MSTYNHYGFRLHPDIPTTGVITNNRYPELIDEIISNGTNLSYENWRKDNRKANPEDYYEDGDTYLLGFKYFSKDKLWGEAPREQFCCITSEVYTQITRSEWLIRCAPCSPCYPGQGDVETPGDQLAYAPHPEDVDDPDVKKRIFMKGKPTIYDIRRRNDYMGFKFFSRENMRFFKDTLENFKVIYKQGAVFITRRHRKHPQADTMFIFSPDTGDVKVYVERGALRT